MFSQLATKAALKKVGLPSNAFDFNPFAPSDTPQQPRREPNKLRKNPPPPRPEADADDGEDNGWGSWIPSVKIPLTIHPWLAPPPPPVSVARIPNIGDAAPVDRDRKLRVGGGRKTLVVFLRCVGCACMFPRRSIYP
jgi:hypothetical protein